MKQRLFDQIPTRWCKVWNDLSENITRTAIIVLSIAVGLFAMGTILSSRAILSTEMEKSYAAINPSSGSVRTLQLFDDGFIDSVQAMPEVAEVDARRVVEARIQDAQGEWRLITIYAVEDYEKIRINKISPEAGEWPPSDKTILIERAALPVLGMEIGENVTVEFPNGTQRVLEISGTSHDLAQIPAQFDNSPYGYVSFKTLEWFGEEYGLNEIYVIADQPHDKERAQIVTGLVKSKAEKSGYVIPVSMTWEPGQMPLNDILQAVLLILGILGGLSLFLSAFLIVNTVSALLTQQRRQIGIMKAVGARTRQVMGMYLVMVLMYGLGALILAVPASALGSNWLSNFLAGMFNFDIAQTKPPELTIAIQILVGVMAPVLSALYPLLSNARLSASEAMSDYQSGRGRFGANWFDQMLSGARLWFARGVFLRPFLLSIRNTFRSKGRLLLTLITLTLASGIFISVFSLQASLNNTVGDLMKVFNFDASYTFTRPYRIERLIAEAKRYPAVEQADIWLVESTRRVRSDGHEGGTVMMVNPRLDSELAPSPGMVAGRWLVPEDDNGLVVNTIFLKNEPDIRIGDEITLKIAGKEQPFRVVGVSMGILFPMVHAPYPFVAELCGSVGKTNTVLVQFEGEDSIAKKNAADGLETMFEVSGMQINFIQTMSDEKAEVEASLGVIVALLLVMAGLLAAVGGLGLTGAMSINVLERRREIGVLRAIGANDRRVAQVFILEGIAIGVMSWLLGTVMAIPMGQLFSRMVGAPLLGASLSFSYSVQGMWAWLVLVILLSALASYAPARGASQLTVREVLAYE